MRSAFKILTTLVAVFALTIGCSGDDAMFNYPDSTIDPDGIIDYNSNGYLQFSGLSLDVINDAEKFTSEESQTVMTTRSESEDDSEDESEDESIDTSNYTIKITREDSGEVVYTATYAEAKDCAEPLVLKAGAYIVEAYSCEESKIATVAWDKPEYSGSDRYVVGDDKITEVGTITCRLSNVMVSITMAADFMDLFKADADIEEEDIRLQVIVECGGNEQVFYVEDQGRLAYFKAPSDGEMTIYLMGMYNTASSGESANYMKIDKGDWVQEIDGVVAGQYRNISIKIDHNATGSILIGVTIQTWVEDDTIVVSVTKSPFTTLVEDVILDPDDMTTMDNAPVVTLESGEVTSKYVINSSILDIYTETYSPAYKAYITPEDNSTIKSVSLTISSTSTSLVTALSEAGIVGGAVDIYDTQSSVSVDLSSYISVYEDSNSGSVVVALKYNAILALSEFIGVHTFTVQATDSQNRVSFTDLYIESASPSDAPQIEWVGDYDFDTRYQIYEEDENGYSDPANPEVVLNITSIADAGLQGLILTISSETLPGWVLESVGFAEVMDLVDGDATLLANVSKELNLPVGDEIRGKSEVTLDVSEFISMLAELGSGESNFKIEATDAKGTTIKYIMLEKK